MDLWILLSDIVVLLAASLVLGGIAARLGQSPIVGYLFAGMLLGGPGSLHLVKSQNEIEAISELGVALLLFSLGLEFSWERLKQLGPRALIAGAAQVLVTLFVGTVLSVGFGTTLTSAIAVGAMISLSSTAVVLRTLMDRAHVEMPHGRNCLAVLLIQDIAVVPLALLITLLVNRGGPAAILTQLGALLGMTAVLVAALMIVNRIAVLALGTLTLHRNRELTVILAVVSGLGAAWSAHAVGISPALGAFIAGMLLGSSSFSTQIRADVSSLRVVLLTLFFGAAGMVADPVWIATHWISVVGITALVIVGKMIIVVLIFSILRQSMRVAAATGLCLAQIGEFAFVLGSIGRGNGVVSNDLYALVVSVAIVSIALAAIVVPMAPRFGAFIASRIARRDEAVGSTETGRPSADVVIIGFGPAGRIASRSLMESGASVLVIDLNQEGVRRAKQFGFQGQIGDATQSEVLEHARISQAAVVVITIPHQDSALMILERVRQMAPAAHLVVRSRYQRHSESFVSAGAHVVVGDEENVGEFIATHLRERLLPTPGV